MKITVVGAGFTGLTLAHYLQKHGFELIIYEKLEDPGGLIATAHTEHGMAETAANALLADQNVEDLFVDIGVEFADRDDNAAKKRYIYRDGPRRWPLSWGASWLAARRILTLMVSNNSGLWPQDGESVHKWGLRVFDREFTELLLEPALQGIYAGDPRKLSANLIVHSLLKDKAPKGYYRGSVAPVNGMGAMIQELKYSLEAKGALFQFKSQFKMPEFVTNPIVICTSAWAAAEILKDSHPQWAQLLGRCESLQLARVTCFFKKSDADLDGFGCLFPANRGFFSLGVLFDSCIFPNRSEHRAESWILGGALNNEITAWSDSQVLKSILSDREKLLGETENPIGQKIVWWPRAVPHYTTEWEKALRALRPVPPLFLHGNYLGQLGLSKILARSKQLALEIKESYG